MQYKQEYHKERTTLRRQEVLKIKYIYMIKLQCILNLCNIMSKKLLSEKYGEKRLNKKEIRKPIQ